LASFIKTDRKGSKRLKLNGETDFHDTIRLTKKGGQVSKYSHSRKPGGNRKNSIHQKGP